MPCCGGQGYRVLDQGAGILPEPPIRSTDNAEVTDSAFRRFDRADRLRSICDVCAIYGHYLRKRSRGCTRALDPIAVLWGIPSGQDHRMVRTMRKGCGQHLAVSGVEECNGGSGIARSEAIGQQDALGKAALARQNRIGPLVDVQAEQTNNPRP